jgi:hypothetical protein
MRADATAPIRSKRTQQRNIRDSRSVRRLEQVVCFLGQRKRSIVTAATALVCLCLIALVFTQGSRGLAKVSDEFVAQVNLLGPTLAPGAFGTIHVSECAADELILLPAFCDRSALANNFAGRSLQFIDTLYDISRIDQTKLIWVRRGRMVSINPARFNVGVTATLRSWPLHGSREIRVTKESQSPNGFVSLVFLADGD